MNPRALLSLVSTTVLVYCGCVSIPQLPYLVSVSEGAGEIQPAVSCGAEKFSSAGHNGDGGGRAIDPAGFVLFNWNIKKNSRQGWRKDLASLAHGADIVTLQESRYTDELQAVLAEGGYRWELAASFLYRGRETGVLTAAKAAGDASCVSRVAEPWVDVPKMALASLFPVAGGAGKLLVVNAHLVNLGVAEGRYSSQLDELERLMAAQVGPLVLAGDFNTWSGGRQGAVAAMVESLGLREVVYDEGEPAAFFGSHVDHVFYRGLTVRASRAIRVDSSDHFPLLVEFEVEGKKR